MLQNYLKHALRYISRHRVFSAINIGGLIVSVLSCAIILNYVIYEYSYDNFEQDPGEVFRVNLLRKNSDQRHAAIGPPMGPALKNEYGEVEKVVRLRHANSVLISLGSDEFYETKVFYADSGFFELFPYEFNAKIGNDPISQVNTVVISENLANKYFGNEAALGKTILIDNEKELKITGVVKESKFPQHLQFEMIISFSSFEVPFGYPVTLDTWGWTSFPTYIKLAKNVSANQFNQKLDDFIVRNMGEETAQAIGLELQAVKDIHLNSQNVLERDGTAPKGSLSYIKILIVVAVAILFLAMFNFINLSTALSIKRVNEVGVRKVLGAHRRSIFKQFMLESIMMVTLALSLAIIILLFFGKEFNSIFSTPFFLKSYLFEYWYLLVVFAIVLGLAGGAYPANVIARFSASETFGTSKIKFNKPGGVKSFLVGIQYFITIGLIVGSIAVGRQMNFLASKDLGYKNDNVLVLKVDGPSLTEKFETIKKKLLKNSSVASVTATGNMFDGQNGSVPVYKRANQEDRYRINLLSANHDFLETMDISLVYGRDFSENFANDSSSFILNQEAADMLNVGTNDLGEELMLNDVWEGQLIGVTENFHFASLHENIGPIIMFFPRSYVDRVFIRLNNDNDYQAAINTINADFKEVFPQLPFDYKFLKDHVSGLYQTDKLFANAIYFFSTVALILACLGLFAIISFQIETRQKELSIKKILGASDWKITLSLIKQFVIFISIAALVVIPLSIVSINKWLEGFAYKINLNVWDVLIALVLIVVITAITLSRKIILAIHTSPLKHIKEN